MERNKSTSTRKQEKIKLLVLGHSCDSNSLISLLPKELVKEIILSYSFLEIPKGIFVRKINTLPFPHPRGVDIDSKTQRLFVSTEHKIQIFNLKGKLVSSFGDECTFRQG